jgi:hypothetical protein
LSLRSIDESFIGVRFYDDLNASAGFVPGSLSLVSYPAGADVSQTGNGILDIRNLNVPAGSTIAVTFDITLDSTLNEGFVVLKSPTATIPTSMVRPILPLWGTRTRREW